MVASSLALQISKRDKRLHVHTNNRTYKRDRLKMAFMTPHIAPRLKTNLTKKRHLGVTTLVLALSRQMRNSKCALPIPSFKAHR